MSQAKGVLPRGYDRGVLLKNPRTCGYFISVTLRPDLDRVGVLAWFGQLSTMVEELLAPTEADGGQRPASIAVGLGPSFFTRGGVPRFDPPIEPPAAFRPDPASPLPNSVTPLANAAVIDAEVMLYVATTREARVSRLLERLWATRPDVTGVGLERGYQRDDEREAFGYLDGLRNVVPATSRAPFVFVDRDDRHIEEPAWADGGTYMVFAKIAQHQDAFFALDQATRDQLIGRDHAGVRLDLVGQRIEPRKEPSEFGALPEFSHVRKSGPRGERDDCQIFRRGMPFVEASPDGQVRVGLQFCSFQASLDQFDVVFNDWMTNGRFPSETSGVDGVVDPSRGLTTFEKSGFFFVPPHDESGVLAASLFKERKPKRPKQGRLVIRKRVVDQFDPTRRFERRGFNFVITDAAGSEVARAVTDSTGRAVVDKPLEIGATYRVAEVEPIPVSNVPLAPPQEVLIERSHQELRLLNQVTVPNTGYGVP